MPPVHTSSHRLASSSASVKTHARNPQGSPNRALRELAALNTSNIMFPEVLKSMHGPLFPVDDVAVRTRGRRTPAQLDLLDTLLNTSPWDARVSESPGSPVAR